MSIAQKEDNYNMPTKDEMKKFAYAIDSLVANTDYTYLEAIVEYCTKIGMEIEIAASLINSDLKSKIEAQAMELNLLKVKTTKLPI
jgi:hypothetical protein